MLIKQVLSTRVKSDLSQIMWLELPISASSSSHRAKAGYTLGEFIAGPHRKKNQAFTPQTHLTHILLNHKLKAQKTTSPFRLPPWQTRKARHQRIHFLLVTQRLTGRFSPSPLRQSTLAFRDLDTENPRPPRPLSTICLYSFFLSSQFPPVLLRSARWGLQQRHSHISSVV